MSLPLLTQPLESDRDVVSARQRARARRAPPRLRAPGPDARRHRGLGGRAQRGPARRPRACWSSRSTRRRPRRWRRACATRAPASPRSRRRCSAAADRRHRRASASSVRAGWSTGWTSSRPGARARRSGSASTCRATTRPLDGRTVRELSAALAREGPNDVATELQQQNRELAQALEELQGRHDDLDRMKRELEETNRGVVALYAELDEKAEHLRRSDVAKTRFLSNVSHEFRTPLNSILALSRLLQERADGDLTSEQEKQVGFIVKAARSLSDLVDDLLDLAKVEAGKIVVRPAPFELSAAVRRAARHAAAAAGDRRRAARLRGAAGRARRSYGDEGKVAQILRNLLSNALKFTEQGEVRLRAGLAATARASCSRSATPASASPPRTRPASSRSSASSSTRCSAASRAPGSASRCRGGWPSCWAATSRSTAPPARARPSPSRLPLALADGAGASRSRAGPAGQRGPRGPGDRRRRGLALRRARPGGRLGFACDEATGALEGLRAAWRARRPSRWCSTSSCRSWRASRCCGGCAPTRRPRRCRS